MGCGTARMGKNAERKRRNKDRQEKEGLPRPWIGIKAPAARRKQIHIGGQKKWEVGRWRRLMSTGIVGRI
jgi:hypothetical protein